MTTENTSLKNVTPAGDATTTNEMVIGKINTYQRTFLIVAGSLLALLVLIVVAGNNGVQHLQSSAHETAEGAVALADYKVDSVNLALTKDIFGLGAVSENEEGLVPVDELIVTNSININKSQAVGRIKIRGATKQEGEKKLWTSLPESSAEQALIASGCGKCCNSGSCGGKACNKCYYYS